MPSAFDLPAERRDVQMGDGISALQIRMLGDFSITYHGQRLCLKNSLTTKSMIALQLLLYRGEAGAARETLVDALFYNDNSADPLNNLKVTVSNLRRFLAGAGLPPEMTVRAKSKRYYFSSPEPVWLDTAAFDKWQNYLIKGLIMVANVFDPEVIVLSGSMAKFVEYDKVSREVNGRILTQPFELKEAAFENNAGMIGAALLLIARIK